MMWYQCWQTKKWRKTTTTTATTTSETFSHANLIITIILRCNSMFPCSSPMAYLDIKNSLYAHIRILCVCVVLHLHVLYFQLHCHNAIPLFLKFHRCFVSIWLLFSVSFHSIPFGLQWWFRLSVVTRTIFKLPVCLTAWNLRQEMKQKRSQHTRVDRDTNEFKRNAHVYINCFSSGCIWSQSCDRSAHAIIISQSIE